MGDFRFRLDYVLVASLLLNAGLLGFVVALLLVPGPRPAFMLPHGEMEPMAVKIPEFGFENRLFLAQILEQDAEGAAERARRAYQARLDFSEILSAENPQADEIAARGEALKVAMDAMGGGFLDAIVKAASKLNLEERRKLAAFILRSPSADFILATPEGSGLKRVPAFAATPFDGASASASLPSGEDEGGAVPARSE